MKNKLNILEINFSRAWGGLEMQMPLTAMGLKKLGHNVIVVCPEGSPAEKAALKDSLKVIRLENKINYIDIFTAWKLAKIIKENKIDIIHSHMAKDLWMVIPAAKIAGHADVYFTRHIESHYRKKDIFHYILHRSLTGTIAITNAVKESLLETTHILPESVDVIYGGVDMEKIDKILLNVNVLRDEYNIDKDKFLIGVVGRLQEGKGHEYLLRTIPRIIEYVPGIRIFIVGEETKGEEKGYKEHLEGIAKESGISDKVIFTGFRQDVPAVMNSLDILIMPSQREAFGLVAIEAMAMGKTVIAAESPGTREIIDDGVNGFLVPYGNIEMLSERVVRILNNPEARKTIGEMARKKVEKNFEFNKNIKRLENIFYGKNNK